jgi:WD40 repeat protein
VRVVTPGAHPEEVLSQAPPGDDGVFVIDQCEEALALPESSPEREAFFAGLVRFAARGRLVLSLRADRLGELAVHPEFAHLVEKGLYLLGAMGPAELRSAIEGPAAQAGLRLEPGLVDLLVRDVEGSPGALPLLSHVLRQTWRRREGDTLTVEGYAATGGVREAVAQSAERLYRGLSPSQQGMLRDLMVRLVSSDDAGEPVRTRVSRRALTSDDEHTAVVEALVGARLVSSDGDTVEIAHESLAVAWPRLRSWLDDDVDGLRTMRHLTVAAESWDELGRPDSELYRGVRQARAAEWRRSHDPELTPAERAFLDTSAELAESEQRATEEQVRRERRSNQRLRTGLAAVAVLLAVSIVAGALAKTSAERADRQSLVADARRLSAEALRSTEIDRSLLLATASTALDDSADTRFALAQVLDRAPQLIGAARNKGGFISLSLHPDGTTIAAAEPLGGVTIRDATTLAEVARNDEVTTRSVRFSPDGTQLAASANPWTPTGARPVHAIPLRLLDPRTAKLLPTQLGGMPAGRVLHESFAYSANGKWLAAGFIHPREADGRTVFRVWETAHLSTPVAAFSVPFVLGTPPVVSADGRRVLVTSDDAAHVFESSSGRELASVRAERPEGFASSQDGSLLAIRDGNQIRVLDPARLTTVSTLREDGQIDHPIAFDPEGKRVAYVVDGTTVVRTLGAPDLPGVRYPTGDQTAAASLVFGRSGTTLYGGRADGLLLAWDLEGDRRYVPVHASVEHELAGEPLVAAASPDGRTVAHFVRTARGDSLQLRDVPAGTLAPATPSRQPVGWYVGLAWRPDSRAVATLLDDESVRVWARDGGNLLEEHRVPGDGVFAAALGADGSSLVVGTRNGWVRTFGVDGRASGPDIRISTQKPAGAVAVARDGRHALATTGEQIVLLDLHSGEVQRRADLGFVAVGLTWSPDGRTIAATGVAPAQAFFGATAALDAATLAPIWSVVGPQAGGDFPTYSPDGSRFTTVGDEQVRVYDPRSGLVGSLRSEGLAAAAFRADGSTITLVSSTGRISTWDPGPEAARRAACRIAGRELSDDEWRKYLPDRARIRVC